MRKAKHRMTHLAPLPDEADFVGASLLLLRPPVIRRRRLSARAERLRSVLLLSPEDARMSPAELAHAAMLSGTDVLADTMRELVDAGAVMTAPDGPGRVHVTVVLPL